MLTLSNKKITIKIEEKADDDKCLYDHRSNFLYQFNANTCLPMHIRTISINNSKTLDSDTSVET